MILSNFFYQYIRDKQHCCFTKNCSYWQSIEEVRIPFFPSYFTKSSFLGGTISLCALSSGIKVKCLIQSLFMLCVACLCFLETFLSFWKCLVWFHTLCSFPILLQHNSHEPIDRLIHWHETFVLFLSVSVPASLLYHLVVDFVCPIPSGNRRSVCIASVRMSVTCDPHCLYHLPWSAIDANTTSSLLNQRYLLLCPSEPALPLWGRRWQILLPTLSLKWIPQH